MRSARVTALMGTLAVLVATLAACGDQNSRGVSSPSAIESRQGIFIARPDGSDLQLLRTVINGEQIVYELARADDGRTVTYLLNDPASSEFSLREFAHHLQAEGTFGPSDEPTEPDWPRPPIAGQQWSPDGRWFVEVRESAIGVNGTVAPRIYVGGSVAGDRTQQIADVPGFEELVSVQWLGDSSAVALALHQGRASVLTPDSTPYEIVVIDPSARWLVRSDPAVDDTIVWSHDYKQLAFAGGFGRVLLAPYPWGLADEDLGPWWRQQPAVAHPLCSAPFAGSPDGRFLACRIEGGLKVAAFDGGPATPIGDPLQLTGVTWSPDGEHVAFTAQLGSEQSAATD